MSRDLDIARNLLWAEGSDSLRLAVLDLHSKGFLSSDFRQFLEECADGRRMTSVPSSVLEALLRQILMIVFIPPPMPCYLRKLYDDKISEVLNPPVAAKVEKMLVELKEDGLLSQAFAELFLHRLNEWAGKGNRLAASCYWDLCRDILDEKVLERIDRWLG